MALFTIAVILFAGLIWQKDATGMLAIAAVVGGGTRLVGFRVATR